MKVKSLLLKLAEREEAYLAEREIGSKEYNESQERLCNLQRQISELGDQNLRTAIEGIKVAGGIVLPLVGLVWITAAEKEITFTGALREYTRYFLPKK